MRLYFIFLMMSLALCACSQTSKQNQKEEIITVKRMPIVKKLFFKGTIAPITIVNFSSPINGVITKINFTYGQHVSKNQRLFTLKSDDLEKLYEDALTDYLKKKETYFTQAKLYEGTLSLHKEGIVSDNELRNAQAQYNDAYLGYIESRKKLKKILVTIGVNEKDILKLNIANRKTIIKTLQSPTNVISLYAKASGIALKPLPNTDTSSNAADSPIAIGSQVKAGRTLLSIGDIHGIKINVNVDEINITTIKKGQPVSITGVGFPGIVFKGTVTTVSDQANINSSSGLPTFPIIIIVPKITQNQQQQLHVGMSANITINVKKSDAIRIPLNAVFQKNNQNMVTIIDSKHHHRHDIHVQTGTTFQDSIVILKGLKKGDHIVIRNRT